MNQEVLGVLLRVSGCGRVREWSRFYRCPKRAEALLLHYAADDRDCAMLQQDNDGQLRKGGAMRVLSENGNRYMNATGAIGALLFVAIATCAVAQAQERPALTPAAPGADVYFIGLQDGDTVSTKLTINFGLKNMGVAPAGSDRPN